MPNENPVFRSGEDRQLTDVIQSLVNEYPSLQDDESFKFAMAPAENSLAVFPSVGATIQSERESITGHVTQMCIYPFNVVYKASGLREKNKIAVKEWLDDLGRWLGKQPITIGDRTYAIKDWPYIGESREIRNIQIQSPAAIASQNDDMTEDWILSMQLIYRNEFDR